MSSTGIKIVNRVEIPPEMVPVSATTRICLRLQRMSCNRTSSHTCCSFPFGFRRILQEDAKVEITAKVFHGYNAGESYRDIDEEAVKATKGREYGYSDKNGDK